MRTYVQNQITVLALLGALLTQKSLAAVVFTITPSSISNTYNGPVTLQLTGLTNTETVVVQKFLDVNTNGVVDASDLLWQQFQLTDGTNSVFHDGATAVTNFNVPGDTDGTANGTIMAQLNQSADFAQRTVGKYLFKLSSPVGHFSPITNSFNVTNFPFAQKFTGSVVSNGTSTTLPNALVLLGIPDSDGNLNLFSGTVADSAGNYTLQAPPGTYMLVAVKSNFAGNVRAATNLVLNSGATINTNLNLIPATRSIGGNIMDLNNSSLGIPGFLQPAQSQSGQFAMATTDTNGNFTVSVTSGQWGLGHNPQALILHGYLALQNNPSADASTGSVSAVNIALPKATALFYGSIKDTFGNPLTGVWIFAEDNINAYFGAGVTDANGNYVAAVLGGSSTWQLGIDNSHFFPNYVFSQGHQATITNGQASPYNFTAILATNHITGNVQFNGNPVTGVGVNILAQIGGIYYQPATAHTDSNGNYSFNVANGNWSVNVNCSSGGSDDLDHILNSGYQCPNNDIHANINNNDVVVDFTVLPPVDYTNQIFGYVTDNAADPVVGVAVYGNDGIGNSISSTTDDTGYYSIPVDNGSWDVNVDCGGLNLLGYQCVIDQIVNISGNDVEQDFAVQPILSAPTISLPVYFSSSQFQMTVTALAGQNYTVQMSTNLISTNWTSILTTNPSSGSFLFVDPSATNKQRFYRIWVGP